MPGRLFLRDAARLGPLFGVAPPADPPRRNIAPGQQVLVWDGQALAPMRWGIVPVGRRNARGRPVMETLVNARSETLFAKSAFEGTRRAVVPADGWYEWTGPARRKTVWQISGDGPLFFAAITDLWTAPGGQVVPQVATVTCAPNRDVAAIHHRMGVLLAREDIPVWLGPDTDAAAALMVPWPDWRLRIVETADPDKAQP